MNGHSNEFYKPAEPLRELKLLEELEQNPHVSQRALSHKFGIALGVTNACLRKMVRRGWIKIRKVPPRRIGYYLTPHGFSEKSKLAYRLLSNTIHQYAAAKGEIAEKLLVLERSGIKRIVFYGVSDEMEIAYLTLQGVNLELVGIVDDDPTKQGRKFCGFSVDNPREIFPSRPDAVFITSMEARERIKAYLERYTGPHSFQIESI